jgi:hypothetical protein
MKLGAVSGPALFGPEDFLNRLLRGELRVLLARGEAKLAEGFLRAERGLDRGVVGGRAKARALFGAPAEPEELTLPAELEVVGPNRLKRTSRAARPSA